MAESPHRDQLLSHLRRGLPQHDVIRAAWLGGSDATGRADELSDIDLVLVTENDGIEEAIRVVESVIGDVEVRYELPKPTWHGHDQVFYLLANTDPPLVIDLVIMRRDAGDFFLEVERHGEPIILLDRDGIVKAQPLDREGLSQKIRERLEGHRVRFPLFQPLVVNAITRGRLVEAVGFYQALTLKPVVDLLRILHCPDRFDFGMRYLERDLPPDLYKKVEHLCFYANGEELELRRREAIELFRDSLARWDAKCGDVSISGRME